MMPQKTKHETRGTKGAGIRVSSFIGCSSLSALSPARERRRRNQRQAQHHQPVVVGGEAVVALAVAAEAAVEHDLLAVGAGERADGRHEGAAVARPVARHLAVDVARVEAVRAVVAVAAAGRQGTDHELAVAAAKLALRLGVAVGIAVGRTGAAVGTTVGTGIAIAGTGVARGATLAD